MQGFELTTEEEIEIISVYATAEQTIDAVATTPGWNVIGAFDMPATAKVRLDVLGLVSDASLQLRARLYDVTSGSVGAVSGSEAILTGSSDTQVFSGVIQLTGGHTYQVQAEVTGNSGGTYFGTVRRAQLDGQE